jgi:glycerophosphoryl diester phosphodiesterase
MIAGRILAHRGLWHEPKEQNSCLALTRALAQGFGLEPDVRDCVGRLVVSHDPPDNQARSLESLLEDYRRLGASGTLAINIKADGLAAQVLEMLRRFGIENYFVFDMSVPDMLQYRRMGAAFFSRCSDLETEIVGLDACAGVWLDAFQGDWYEPATIESLLSAGKQVAVVSPELHGRDHRPVWKLLRELADAGPQLLCCTDRPGEFRTWMS